MVNVVDQVLGLTGKLISGFLSWPFLLFVLLAWLANRHRDHIGSFLDRRGAVKRSDFSSAVRDEMESVNKEMGDLKLMVNELRAQTMRIEASGSDYSITSALEPIDGRIKALEKGVEKVRSEMEHLLVTALPGEVKRGIEPLEVEMGKMKNGLDQVGSQLTGLDTGDRLNAVSETVEQIGAVVAGLKTDVGALRSRAEDWVPQARADALETSLAGMGGELREVKESLAALQADAGVNDLKTGLERLDARIAEIDGKDHSAELESMIGRFRGDVEALRSDVAQLSSHVEKLVPGATADMLATRIEETRRDLVELQETVGGLKIPLERLSSQVVDERWGKGELSLDSTGNKALPLEIMKQEMRSSRWEWRRVRRLAKSVGMTEEAAEAILESDPDVTLSKDDWGRKIAKLSQR
jgi:predicted  nucleic acid-binding Zn-ribbon protein